MNWKRYSIVAFDTETTGLRPFEGDRVIEFGGVRFTLDDGGEIVAKEELGFLVQPGIPIPNASTAVTGITNEDVARARPFSAHAQAVHDFLSGALIVAHNLPFDRNFLTMEFQQVGLTWPAAEAELDTLDLSRRFFTRERSHRLGELCNRLGVRLEEAHRAVHDATACGEAFLSMTRQFHAPHGLEELLHWAGSVGRPPLGGPFDLRDGVVLFAEGPHAGEPVEAAPLHLAWMTLARAKGPQGWGWRFPESARTWARRWLEIEGAGRAEASAKAYRPEKWGLYPCIAPIARGPE